MSFGLPDATLALIRQTLAAEPALQKAVLYGSRAMGRERAGSDIDIAIWAKEDVAGRLSGALDALPTPYLFDVTDYNRLTNPDLKAHIDLVGKAIFEK